MDNVSGRPAWVRCATPTNQIGECRIYIYIKVRRMRHHSIQTEMAQHTVIIVAVLLALQSFLGEGKRQRSFSYSPAEVQETWSYLERYKTFPPNYYTQIEANFGDIFDNTDRSIPEALAAKNFSVDFSTRDTAKYPPRIVEDALRIAGIRMYRETDRSRPAAEICEELDPEDILEENKLWWLPHCQALRDGDKADQTFVIDGKTEEYSGSKTLDNEYTDDLRYYVKDSLYDTVGEGITDKPSVDGFEGYWYGRGTGTEYEGSWWALLANPRVKMIWPRVTFTDREVQFDWICFDVNTNEMTAYGDVVFFRCGHEGAAYKKYEHLYYLRDAYKPFFDAYFEEETCRQTKRSSKRKTRKTEL